MPRAGTRTGDRALAPCSLTRSRQRFSRLRHGPSSGTRVEGLSEALDVRRAPLSRYPYHLAYLVAGDEIHVLAVAHDRRRPTYWAGRT